ncbi:hypothetical protein CL621_01845 [archaeon]|nr:hypothetical protein [archaeon]|tara:strand:+ start:3639 stop:4367 length:729 start_codon:yes stop_codon:yes gene_type:complete
MIPYKSFISWDLGFLTIQSYGLMLALAFLVGIYLLVKEAKKKEISLKHVYNLSFYCIISGLIGSRIAFVLANPELYVNNFLEVFQIWKGGLVFYGGLFGAIIFAFFYIKKNKLDFWKFADLFSIPVVVSHIIGRIGCILGDGGHVGKLTTVSWGVLVNNEVRHLTAAYSVVGLLIILGILTFLKRKRLKQGVLFLSYLLLYSIVRFIVEIFRFELRYFGLTFAQYICIVLFFGSILLLRKIK